MKTEINKTEYLIAKTRNVFHCSIRKIIGHRKYHRNKYYGQNIKSIDEANQIIFSAIESGKPFLVARFGDAELRALVYAIENDIGLRKGYPEYIKNVMHNNAGFFPANEKSLDEFGKVLWQASQQVDIFGVWFNLLEDYVIHKTSPNAELVELVGLEPYRSKTPWSKALEGKRVLVIHPFEESIKHQYSNHDKLFSDRNVLPDFKLLTYKTVQTNAGGTCEYDSWFEALDAMYNDIKKINFDIAIVGCGSYGLPLAARIKSLGKQVVHLAGATQVLFGIRGARWDARPEMQHLFNEYWVRPLESEKPKDAKTVEGGCYW